MKRYIKSFTTDQLKQQLGDNYPEGGYLYIFKHGIGPGTIPDDVSVVKVKDLPNYYTAVWLDRFLTTSELKQYDIPSETRINELLDRIGYCQKNGDVVPCDEVEACGNIMASTRPHPKIPEGWERVPEGDDDDGNWGTISKALPNNQGYYWINIIEDEQGRRCFELEVGYRGDNGSIGKIWKAASKPFYRLGDIVKYADTKWRQLQNEYDEIDACDNVMASSGIFYTDQGAGIGDRNQVFTEDDLKAAFNSLLAEGDPIANSYDSFESWRDATLDSGLLGVEFIDEDVENFDADFDEADFDDIDATTKPKYFANMVNCSSKYPDFEQKVEAKRFLNSVEPEKVKLVEDCRNELLSAYSEHYSADDDIDHPIGVYESEIIRDYKSAAAEDWEDCTVEEADELFDDIMNALDDWHADDAAAWT